MVARAEEYTQGEEAMATTRRELSKEQQDEQREDFQSASPQSLTHNASQQGGEATQEVQERDGQNGSALSGLKNMNEEKLAQGIGWFSIGLGLAEVLTPRGVARVAGIKGNTTLIRLFGLREIASGVAIFMQQKANQRPAAALWARVAGDALDLACLGAAYASPDSNMGRLTFATANVLAVTALDVICAQQLSSDNTTATGGTTVKKSIVINRQPEELYQFWHDFENLPRFMQHLESVRTTGEGRSHWVAKAPAGTSVEWEAEIAEDVPNKRIAWRSV